jgi:hypothetical protein
MKLHAILATALVCLCTCELFAQWNTGTNPMSTNRKTLISNVIAGASAPGAPPQPPVFQAMTTDNSYATPQITYHLTITDNGNIGFGVEPLARFHVGYGAYFSEKVGIGAITPTEKLHLKDGSFLLTNNTTPVFKLTPAAELTLTNTVASSTFKIASGNVTITNGDLIVADPNQINFRVYKDGTVRAREVRVNLAGIAPDYVFNNDYKLMTFSDLNQYIIANKHLPGIPSAKEMEAEGSLDVSAMQFKLLEKIEELTLYMLQVQKENEDLKKRLCALEQ